LDLFYSVPQVLDLKIDHALAPGAFDLNNKHDAPEEQLVAMRATNFWQ